MAIALYKSTLVFHVHFFLSFPLYFAFLSSCSHALLFYIAFAREHKKITQNCTDTVGHLTESGIPTVSKKHLAQRFDM